MDELLPHALQVTQCAEGSIIVRRLFGSVLLVSEEGSSSLNFLGGLGLKRHLLSPLKDGEILGAQLVKLNRNIKLNFEVRIRRRRTYSPAIELLLLSQPGLSGWDRDGAGLRLLHKRSGRHRKVCLHRRWLVGLWWLRLVESGGDAVGHGRHGR